MSLLSTFCTNSINILAGINGSEVSQAVVIAISVILNDLLFLPWAFGFRIPLPLHVTDGVKVGGVWSASLRTPCARLSNWSFSICNGTAQGRMLNIEY